MKTINNIKHLSLSVMVIILLLAGLFHFFTPSLFIKAMPPYIPFHLEIIYFTGFLEIAFALGLLLKKARFWTSRLLSLYFIAILPAHIHVSLNEIEMFGISHPLLLWSRTVFQGFFIWWALRLGQRDT